MADEQRRKESRCTCNAALYRLHIDTFFRVTEQRIKERRRQHALGKNAALAETFLRPSSTQPLSLSRPHFRKTLIERLPCGSKQRGRFSLSVVTRNVDSRAIDFPLDFARRRKRSAAALLRGFLFLHSRCFRARFLGNANRRGQINETATLASR